MIEKDGFYNRLFYFCNMFFKRYKKPITLGILFFLPVTFLLFLYPSQHNYAALDIVKEHVIELPKNNNNIKLQDQITVLSFYGSNPTESSLVALNLKEMIYDKFKGFKKFQIVSIVDKGADLTELKKELYQYDELKYWNFVELSKSAQIRLFNSLSSIEPLNQNGTVREVFIIDKDRNQRGRLDDREKKEIEKKKPIKSLNAYNCVEVAVLKNKMSEDLRILFTEYRQKRKGEFNSTVRRAEDLKNQ